MNNLKKPVIGIILDFNTDSSKYSYAPLPWYALRACYSQNVEKAGGIPVMLPYNQNIDATLALIDGLIIPGCIGVSSVILHNGKPGKLGESSTLPLHSTASQNW